MKSSIERIFFCSGARNHDLLKGFGNIPLQFEIDERAASFKALGLSKVSKSPAAVCTTSGTAVAECVPAMLEAYYSEVPFILISGDRPKKLHGTGSPQTVDHELITRSCRRSYIEIDLKELQDLDLQNAKFPVHINILVDDTAPHKEEVIFQESLASFSSFLKDKKKPLFLISHENTSMREFVERFRQLKLTFYAETLSGARDLSDLKTEKKVVELFNQGYFDSVIRIGHTPLSKIWRMLEKRSLPVFHFDSRNLPALSYGEILPLSSSQLIKDTEFWKILEGLLPYPTADESIWKLDELIRKYPLSEISVMNSLQALLSEKDFVYLGNSLVIRFFELTQRKNLLVYGNRGVNGIDGQLASAIGVALGTSQNVFCILGDVTTYYDLSSLGDIPQNLFLIIMNNNGGRIFDMLNLDKRIVLEHEKNFEGVSSGFGLSYSNQLSQFGKVKVLELNPDRMQSEEFLKEWMK